jgi:hypothetical protein
MNETAFELLKFGLLRYSFKFVHLLNESSLSLSLKLNWLTK